MYLTKQFRRLLVTAVLAALATGAIFAAEFAWDESANPIERVKGAKPTSVFREAKRGFIAGACVGAFGGIVGELLLAARRSMATTLDHWPSSPDERV